MSKEERAPKSEGPVQEVGAEGVVHQVFHDAYRDSKAAWVTGRPQPAVMTALSRGWFDAGPLLDLGCGTGENAAAIAKERPELRVLAVDAVPQAVEHARTMMSAASLDARVRVEVEDLREFEPSESFGTVLDAGVLHVFSDHDRVAYLEMVARAVMPEGTAIFIEFSDAETRPRGPRRLAREEICVALSEAGFTIDSIEPTRYETTAHPGGAAAWLVRAIR
ncbi:MAG: class I SAM-dependent methyltransferase [Phycisphaerales bacterium]|nr:class I SAM-dependent methyltransferase [Phycisphaerales bacterium]